MPPRRGLKASAKASKPAAEPTETEERAVPLDEDAVTLSDLFELRQNVLTILLDESSTQDDIDEARGFLRGILHGCQSLTMLATEGTSDTKAWFKFNPDSKAVLKDNTKEDGKQEGLLHALGLNELLAPAQVAYLQGFALLELAPLIDTSPPSAATLQGAKKRKLDPNEPASPEDWVDLAIEQFKTAQDWFIGGSDKVKFCEASWFQHFIYADYLRACVQRAELAMMASDEPKAKEMAKDILGFDPKSKLALGKWPKLLENLEEGDSQENYQEVYGPVIAVLVRSLSNIIQVLDRDEDSDIFSVEEKDALIDDLKSALTTSDKTNNIDVETSPITKKLAFEVEKTRADLALLFFITAERKIEAKYRPDADENDEDMEDEEVTPLPKAEDVEQAKTAGKGAVDAIQKSIDLYEEYALNEESVKQEQYQKLVEALLTLSALYNPEETEELDALDKATKKAYKDGGIEEDE